MSGASASTGTVDFVFYFILGVSVFFLFLITFLMVFFIVKYNKKRHTKAKDIHGNTTLEIIWTVIPTVIVIVMFYLGWRGFEFLRNAPKDSMTVNVTARMWSWMFEYENGIQTDTLYVPVETPVKLFLHSQDVIHSFYIPAFRIKEDAVPGLKNHLWFEAIEPGDYHVLCAEYCGLRHAYMMTKVKAMPRDLFNSWYADLGSQVKQTATVEGDTTPGVTAQNTLAGERLIQVKGCTACHSTDGSKMIGPSFKGIFGHETVVMENGQEKTIKVDEEYIRNSILKPNLQVVKGYNPLMPSQEGQISEDELVAIIQYLKSLK